MRLGNQLSQGDIYFPDASGKPIVTGGIQGDILYMPYAKLQALVYDIHPWRRVPESGARSVAQCVWETSLVAGGVQDDIPPMCLRNQLSPIFPRSVSHSSRHCRVTHSLLWPSAHTSSTRWLQHVRTGCDQVPTLPARVGYNMYEHAVTKCPHYQHELVTTCTNTLWPSAHTTSTRWLQHVRTRCGQVPTLPARVGYNMYEHAVTKCPHYQHALVTTCTNTL